MPVSFTRGWDMRVERWPRLDRVVRYGILLLSEVLHHES
jgi:hypothetical protein